MLRFNRPQSDVTLTAFLYGGFVVTGIVTTLLAPLLPLFSAKWSLSDAMVGCLFPAQFIGSKLGNIILSGWLIQRVRFHIILALGYAVMSAGVGMLGFDLGWPLILIAVFCYGAGIGVTIPTANFWVSQFNPKGSAATLNVLNLAWSIGAVVCPAAVVLFERLWNFPVFLLTIAALAALASVSMLCVSRCSVLAPLAVVDQVKHRSVQLRTLLCMAGLFFLYVGVENSIAGWISSLARSTSSTNELWMLAPSFFWGMLLAGRGIAPVALRRVRELHLVIAGLVLAALGTLLLTLEGGIWLIYAGASMSGLGLSSVYPIAIAYASRALPARIATALFFLSGFGGATMPWIVGVISTYMGSLRAGLFVPLLATLAMISLEYTVARKVHTSNHRKLIAARSGA